MSADLQLIHGFHAIESRLRRRSEAVREIYLDASRHDRRAQGLLALAQAHHVKVVLVDTKRLDTLTNQARHQGVAARAEVLIMPTDIEDVLDALTEPPFLLILDGVTDPHNLGACLRVADAMGVHAVLAPKDRAVGLNATVAKVASGAADSVPYLMVTNLARAMRDLKARGIWLIGADEHGDQQLYGANLQGSLAWVLGAEGEGMRRLTRENCDILVRIPMLGSVASLNVSVSAGICLSEARRQRMVADSVKTP